MSCHSHWTMLISAGHCSGLVTVLQLPDWDLAGTFSLRKIQAALLGACSLPLGRDSHPWVLVCACAYGQLHAPLGCLDLR